VFSTQEGKVKERKQETTRKERNGGILKEAISGNHKAEGTSGQKVTYAFLLQDCPT